MKTVPLMGLLLCFGYATACSAATEPEVWADQCAQCHGDDGKAQTPMGKKRQIRNFSDPKVQADLTDDAIFKAIKDGKKSDSGNRFMPPAENVTDDDIKVLMQVVRGFKQ